MKGKKEWEIVLPEGQLCGHNCGDGCLSYKELK